LLSPIDFPDVKLAHHVAIYPVMNMLKAEHTNSYKTKGQGYILFDAAVERFDKAYYPTNQTLLDSHLFRPLKSPAFAGMPSTQVIVAEHDRLHDEGVMYFETLQKAGVDVGVFVSLSIC